MVSHLWIESCGQGSCFIDEKNYILRDAKKEKEIGFSMPVSLARASQCPLLEVLCFHVIGCIAYPLLLTDVNKHLQGRRVLITPNAKPSKEIISGLVKAVQGQVCRFLSVFSTVMLL